MIPEQLLTLAGRLEGRNVLVSGASGPIGRRLVEILSRAGVQVRVLTRKKRNWSKGVEAFVTDLGCLPALTEACQGIHTLFHLASYSPSRHDPAPEDHPMHWLTTAEGSRNLLAAAMANNVRRFLFTSSTRVMEEKKSGYAKAKKAAEEAIAAQGNLSPVILRLPPVYGFAYRGFVAEMISSIEAGRLPPMPDFGDRRSLIHVDDAIQSLLLSSLDVRLAGTWVVTDLQVYSLQSIQAIISRALGKPARRPWHPFFFVAGAHAGELAERLLQRRMPLNHARLRKLRVSTCFNGEPFAQVSNYSPLYTLETALPEILELRRATPSPRKP